MILLIPKSSPLKKTVNTICGVTLNPERPGKSPVWLPFCSAHLPLTW